MADLTNDGQAAPASPPQKADPKAPWLPDPSNLPTIEQQERTQEILEQLSRGVDPRLEYVAGGILFSGTAARALSHYFDDIEMRIGADTYQRMLHDPEVNSCVWDLICLILAEGLQPIAAVNDAPVSGDEDEDDDGDGDGQGDYELAREIADFCARSLRGLKSFHQTLEQMLQGMVFGNKVAEIVLQVAESGPDKDKLVLKALKVKPRRTTAFVVDGYMNVLGLIYAKPGTLAYAVGSFFSIDTPNYLMDPALILPREKFFVFTNRPNDDDPRGTSIARSAYNAWNLKQQVWPEHLRWLLANAVPIMLGYLAPDSKSEPLRDRNGRVRKDAAGNVIQGDPAQAMLETLIKLRNATAAVFPNGAEVTPVETKGNGAQFKNALDVFNSEITKALLGQTRATREARFGSKADSGSATDLLYQIVMVFRATLAETVRNDIFRLLVRLNFGDDCLHLTPLAGMGKQEKRNFADDGQTVAQLKTAGYFDDSQLPGIDAMLGLPKRAPKPEGEEDEDNDPDQDSEDKQQPQDGKDPDQDGDDDTPDPDDEDPSDPEDDEDEEDD